MNRVLKHRILRDLKKNALRYLALFLLIVLGMYMVVSLVGSAESIISTVREAGKRNRVEDGEFSVFVPLKEENKKELKERGVLLEETFYLDYVLEDKSSLRIYKNREKINQIEVEQGRVAEKPDEIVLEVLYAGKHGIKTGDTVSFGGQTYKVTGTGSVADYEGCKKNTSDTNPDSKQFGLGFVTADAYETLLMEGKASKVETYVYSYRLGEEKGSKNDFNNKELKDYLLDIKIDREEITDIYFLEMLEELEEPKNEMKEGIDELSDGAGDLSDGLLKLDQNSPKLVKGANQIFDQMLVSVNQQLSEMGMEAGLTEKNYRKVLDGLIQQFGSMPGADVSGLKQARETLDKCQKFKEGVKDYTEGCGEAKDGANDLSDGVKTLKKDTDEFLEETFPVSVENITEFMEKGDNPKIEAAVSDVEISRSTGLVAGIIVMVLFTYVISVFVIHGIEKESSVIGALYALGATKGQLLMHYLSLPVMITFLGGIAGTLLGLSPVGAGYQAQDTIDYFSIPKPQFTYPAYLILYGVLMPVVAAVLVNLFVINKKLSQTALSLIRNEQKQKKIRNLKLGKLKFIPLFQIRQFFREIRSSITIVAGMFVALMVMMIGLNCYVLCKTTDKASKEDAHYEYMYTFKYPEKEVPEGGEACYVRELKKETYGYKLGIMLYGIDSENPYFDFKVKKGKNQVAVAQSTAEKFGISEGDKLVLSDEVNDMDYVFKVERIVPYSLGLTVFMDIDSMRELFGEQEAGDGEEGYYNAVLSDHDLAIESGRLYAVTSRNDIEKSGDVFMESMQGMIVTMILVSAIMFIIVMYLMVKVMIDRSSFHISLMKIFGFNAHEVRRLYLNGNFIMVAVSALFCIPFAKWLIDHIYPYFISNVACGMNLKFSVPMYLGIYGGVLVCYFMIDRILSGRLKKVVPAEVLKNRE